LTLLNRSKDETNQKMSSYYIGKYRKENNAKVTESCKQKPDKKFWINAIESTLLT